MAALAAAVVFLIAALAAFPLKARAEEVTEIRTYEDLLKIADNPSGSYQLMNDIDLKDKTWTPVDFTGSFDGNGHAILNATITGTGPQTFESYDGNLVSYDTRYAGFFSSLTEGARVSNLKLLGVNINVSTDEPVFAGGIAGYMDTGAIADCTVYGSINLHTTGQSFGAGGVAGFGNGVIAGTNSDMTLVCVDEDTEYKEEQFMGGAYAAGYIDLANNSIKIDGYDSDHGYVHNGGLVGMYILYPEDNGYSGYVVDNTLSGQITFFEDNEDRRAYCEPYIGEIMNWSFAYDDAFSGDNFTGNEVFEYDTVLQPHTCENPKWEQTVVESTETENGYTEYRCSECGYTYRADFKPVLEGSGQDGAAGGNTEDPSSPAGDKSGGKKVSVVLIIMIILFVIVIALITFFLIRRSQLEKQRQAERREQRNNPPKNRDRR